MLDVAAAQFRYTLSLLFGWRFSVRSLERMLAALRETQREFGAMGKEGSEVVDGPALDVESRRRIQLHRFRQQAKRAMRDTAYYSDLFNRLELDLSNLGYEDISRLPCTPKEAVRDDPDAFVSRQARPYLRATTTGTTGTPTSICFSEHELRVYFALLAMSTFFTHDLQERDLVQISTSARGTLSNVCLAGACTHLGAMVELAGVVDPAQALAWASNGTFLGGGLGDFLLVTVFVLSMEKAFGRAAAILGILLSLLVIAALLLIDQPWPGMIFLAPVMLGQYLYWRHRYPQERTMQRYLQQDVG